MEKTGPETPKGYRDGPGRVALEMGFKAASSILDRIEVRQMTGREFYDLVKQLAYTFEGALEEPFR